jgi:hypothetical protein
VALSEDLERIAEVARGYAGEGEAVAGIVAAEPTAGARAPLCAFANAGGSERSWVALDDAGAPIEDRTLVREAVSISALCEVAADHAGGGDLGELRSRLLALRVSENPPGIDEAEDAALALERALGVTPRLATPTYLDEVGAATRRLERALGTNGVSPLAETMQQAMASIEGLTAEIDRGLKRPPRS